MRVVELNVENFMGLKLAEIMPGDRPTVVIGGENGQGKTSLLDAIECAIRGKAFHPDQPVHAGAAGASVNLDLGELRIRRRFKPDGSSTIRVENREGFEAKRPQAMLDALAGAISFDPLEFARMDAKKRLELVRELAGVDTSLIDAEREQVFEERTAANREVRDRSGEFREAERYPDAPAERISVADAVEKLSAAQAHNRERIALAEKRDAALRRCQHHESRIDQIKRELAESEASLDEDLRRAREARDAFEAMAEIECDPLHEAIRDAEAINARVDANERWKRCKDLLEGAQEHSAALTHRLQEIEAEKAELLANANLPVPGLSWDDEQGVTLDGIPFVQRSAAERLEASIQIGMALAPRLRVMLVRDGCLLDDAHMQLVSDWADRAGYQFWIERVGTNDAGAIVIEEGEVRAATSEATP